MAYLLIFDLNLKGAMPNGDRVLEISRLALIDEGILGNELDFEFVFHPGRSFLISMKWKNWLWRAKGHTELLGHFFYFGKQFAWLNPGPHLPIAPTKIFQRAKKTLPKYYQNLCFQNFNLALTKNSEASAKLFFSI